MKSFVVGNVNLIPGTSLFSPASQWGQVQAEVSTFLAREVAPAG